MRSTGRGRHEGLVWDVACPSRPSRVPGVSMAGFRDTGMAPDGHRLIPHPAVTLVLDFGPGPPIVDDAAGKQHRGSLVAGIGLGHAFGGTAWVRGTSLECIQIRLSPVLAGAVLGVRPCELDGALVPLDELWGRNASLIAEQLHALSRWEDRFAVADAVLTERCAAGLHVDSEVSWAWSRITATHGTVRVDELAAELGWSRKRMWSRFYSQIGLPPKSAAKLVRFDYAVHRLVAGEEPAVVAAEVGYADQSHLHRDVVTLTGVTPRTVAGEPFLAVDDTAWPAETNARHRAWPANKVRA